MLLIVLATLAIAWLAVAVVVMGACVSAARGDRAIAGVAAQDRRAAYVAVERSRFSFAARPSQRRAA